MDDFASASMLRLLLRATFAEGLVIPSLPALPAEGARVPLEHKQQLVGAVVRHGGLPLLLRLAQQVRHIEGEPLHQALVAAADPHQFLLRWQRLERHVHARHRVQALSAGPRWLLLEHVARPGLPPPSAAESVAVLGVWIGAQRALGVQGLRVRIGRHRVAGPGRPPGSEAAEQAVADTVWASGSVQRWRMGWDRVDPPPPSRSSHQSPSSGASQTSLQCMTQRPADAFTWPWPEPAASLAGWLAQDPAGSPRLADAAAVLQRAPRTLQRQLAQAGSSFSALLGEVRVRLAAAWLVQPGPGLAEIGFACGYADQAHFTREFTRHAGLSPARYRAAALSA